MVLCNVCHAVLIDCYRRWPSTVHVMPLLFVCYNQRSCVMCVMPVLIDCYRRWPSAMHVMPSSLNARWWSVCGVFGVTVL